MKFRKNSPTVILLVFLALSLVISIPRAYSTELTAQETAEWSAQDETLAIAKYLFELDMTKYSPQLISDTFPPNSATGTEDVLFTLGNVSYLHRDVDFSCTFTNQKLTIAMYSINNGTPFYTETQPANAVDATKAFLERYQAYSGVTYVQAMLNMLNGIDSTKNIDVTSGGIRLRVTTNPLSFRFDKIVNGLETQEWLEVDFAYSYLSVFVDKWNTVTIGSTDINITKDEAIEIARNYLKTYSWNVSQGNGTLFEVKNFNVLETPVDVSMWMYPRPTDSSTVYPHWHVVLYLDKIYAGNVGSIAVGVWADTGEIVYCVPLSYGIGNPEKPATQPPKTESFPTTWIAATIVIVVMAATVGYLVYRRRK